MRHVERTTLRGSNRTEAEQQRLSVQYILATIKREKEVAEAQRKKNRLVNNIALMTVLLECCELAHSATAKHYTAAEINQLTAE